MKKNSFKFLFLFETFICGQSEKLSARVDDVKCEAQLKSLSASLSKRETWALDLFDSWTKFQAGITYGNQIDFGNFDQCTEFQHISSDSSVGLVQGQHCVIYYRATANASTSASTSQFDWSEIGSILRERQLRLGGGVCLPSSCSPSRIQSFVNEFLKPADLEIATDYDQSQWCSTNEPIPFETIDVVCIIILSLLALLLLSSTIHEQTMKRKNHKPHELYAAFSVYKNGVKLFDVDRKSSSNVLKSLYGLRTLAMLHIMLGHRFSWSRGFPNVNSSVHAVDGKWLKTLFSAFVVVSPIAVDAFFVMGGLLITRSTLHQMEKGKFNILKLYLHRYLRTIPVLGLLILIILSILKFFGDGPQFTFFANSALISQCEQYWWTALLHIQNYYNPLETCLQASWYLSADFQLVLISPLLLYPIAKWGWKFLWLLPAYVVGTEVWIFVLSWRNEYKAARLLMPLNTSLNSAVETYFPTHVRCGPWLTGVMLGYVFYQTREQKVVINKYINAALWILSISTIVSILVGMLPLQSVDNPAGQFANSLWMALARNTWAYSIAWIIFACHNGTGGIFKWFLELPCWQPLGRMSLSFYLVHTIYQTIAIGSGKIPLHFNQRDLLHSYAGDFVVTFFLATILFLTLEEPILLIENYIYKQIATKTRKDEN